MKKYIYILVIVFLTYGKGYASSFDLFKSTYFDATETILIAYATTTTLNNGKLMLNDLFLNNDFCINPSPRCIDYSFPMNVESEKHENCAKFFLSHQGMKTFGITTIYYTSIDTYKTDNYLSYQVTAPTYSEPNDIISKRLQNLDIDHYFSEPLNPAYIKGFGVILKI